VKRQFNPLLLWLTMIVAAPVVAGCASRPDPALKLVSAQPAGASNVKLLVATTRRQSDDPAIRFSGERSLTLRYASLDVSVPKERQAGEISWPTGGTADPLKNFSATRFDAIPNENIRSVLRESVAKSGKHHVLVFVHGYNTRFDEAAFRLAQIVQDSGAPVTPVLFSWPSWGTLAAYPYDRESAAISRDGLETILRELAKEPSVTQVSILAHSMGGWLTLESLRQMAIRERQIFPKITDLMLAAPDVDVDVAAAQGRALQGVKPRPKITLFVSADDKALRASNMLWGSRARLGSLDPNEEPFRTNLAKNGVEVIDLTGLKSSDSLNHGKFASSPLVVRQIGQRLADGQALEGSTSFGERSSAVLQGTVRTVGDVVTAPLRVGSNPGGLDAPESLGKPQ
jgi:esterase/lipase superfamily enzyme